MPLVNAGQIKALANKYMRDASATRTITYKSITTAYANAEETETVVQMAVRGIVAKYGKLEISNSAGAVQDGDLNVLVAAKYFEDAGKTPTVKDRMAMDGIDWEVVAMSEKIQVGSTGIMYEFRCRK